MNLGDEDSSISDSESSIYSDDSIVQEV